MIKFILLILSAVFSFFLLFHEKEVFFSDDMVPSTSVQNIVPAILEKDSATVSPKKITPVISIPSKVDAVVTRKSAPKVALPLVHYTENDISSLKVLVGSEIIAWTNTYRERNKFQALKRNEELDRAAIAKVHDMFTRGYFEHVSPTGKNAADLVSGAGYEYVRVGENLALGIFSDEKDLTDAWMASPGHRANILSPYFEEIGVDVEEGEYKGEHVWMAVQEFGKPSSSCSAPEISVKTEIERNRKDAETLSTQANALVSEMNEIKDDVDTTAYNQKVSEYNALVAKLNPLIEKMRLLFLVYNKEVNEYNVCIGAA